MRSSRRRASPRPASRPCSRAHPSFYEIRLRAASGPPARCLGHGTGSPDPRVGGREFERSPRGCADISAHERGTRSRLPRSSEGTWAVLVCAWSGPLGVSNKTHVRFDEKVRHGEYHGAWRVREFGQQLRYLYTLIPTFDLATSQCERTAHSNSCVARFNDGASPSASRFMLMFIRRHTSRRILWIYRTHVSVNLRLYTSG